MLVIIGILASLMLGALNGYIDKAKEKTLTANTRSIYLAAQTVASEQYANGNTTDILSDDKNLADVDSLSGGLLTQYGSGNYAITVEAGKVISVSVTDSGIKKDLHDYRWNDQNRVSGKMTWIELIYSLPFILMGAVYFHLRMLWQTDFREKSRL